MMVVPDIEGNFFSPKNLIVEMEKETEPLVGEHFGLGQCDVTIV
jgi:hypothetical protein